ncbi:CPBP family intramembrane glutamic endopeptidase [Clostridium hydrogenum]|uniref:CPBP family intramembrane glutamic endopeptidase n=1 Tax=Clostridium hydrogenum TaxID=2855764 RepID=UPI001F2C2EA1|nr:CPBP family intramembrane glutamic endopeptidase [Clostridium hydrogenum]
MKERKLTIKVVWISYIVFMLGWIFRVYYIDSLYMNKYVEEAISVFIKIVWWLGFSIFLLKRYNCDLNIKLKEMFTNKLRCRMLVPIILIVIFYHIVGIILLHNGVAQMKLETYDLVVTVLTVGIFEESLFRGWFLNAFSSFMSERKANILSSILFVSAHFPGWIHDLNKVSYMFETGIGIFILGLVFGLVFRKTKSIWAAVIIHSLWDLGEFLM